MKQASDIRDAVNPDEILFVVDAMMGQDAVRTSQAFLDGVGFDGVVLTKLDGDARGGVALSIASLTKRPIMFASTGEKLHEFDIFYPDRMASRILGLGDVATTLEGVAKQKAQKFSESLAKSGRSQSSIDALRKQFESQFLATGKKKKANPLQFSAADLVKKTLLGE
jgi:signal recognition particle subunit SRP54